ncbi:metal ABC transporter permease [Lusitaniella coriacea]|uniref:metal ABC transporter permease n=1 Tax=Lusitaniella coriacea TaxID=1983105 RepID=UPI001E40613E|nr:metal ABC transporter permease [Lusitaniella coriacea]
MLQRESNDLPDPSIHLLATAAGIGATSGVMGMVISDAIDLPNGPSIVLVQLFGFLTVALWCR